MGSSGGSATSISGQDAYLEAQTPRLGGYPLIPLGEEATCGTSNFLEGEMNTGDWQSTKPQHVRLDITAGSSHSGGPYYFWNAAQSRYKVFGIHAARKNPVGSRYACGPKIPYWRNTILTLAAALGGTW